MFDPTKPADHSEIIAAELRGQFTALKTLIDDRPTNLEMYNFLSNNSPVIIDNFQPLQLTISNPPTQAEVKAILDKLNTLIGALQH